MWYWRGTQGTVILQGLGGVRRHFLRASCALGVPTERLLCLVPSDATGWQKMEFCSTVHGNCGGGTGKSVGLVGSNPW